MLADVRRIKVSKKCSRLGSIGSGLPLVDKPSHSLSGIFKQRAEQLEVFEDGTR